jgi:hypothetical protein
MTALRIISKGRSSWTRPASYHRSAVWETDLPEPPSPGEFRFIAYGIIAGFVAVYCIGSFAA